MQGRQWAHYIRHAGAPALFQSVPGVCEREVQVIALTPPTIGTGDTCARCGSEIGTTTSCGRCPTTISTSDTTVCVTTDDRLPPPDLKQIIADGYFEEMFYTGPSREQIRLSRRNNKRPSPPYRFDRHPRIKRASAHG